MRATERERRSSARSYRPVPLSLIAPDMAEAAVTGEDARFWIHAGIDWREVRNALGYGRGGFAWSSARDLEALWKVRLDATEAPALTPWLARGELTVGDLLRSPVDREEQLRAVVLLVLRADDECTLTPGPDLVLAPGDQLLLAGRPAVRRQLETTLLVDSVPEYLVTGRRVPSGWVWRKLSRQPA